MTPPGIARVGRDAPYCSAFLCLTAAGVVVAGAGIGMGAGVVAGVVEVWLVCVSVARLLATCCPIRASASSCAPRGAAMRGAVGCACMRPLPLLVLLAPCMPALLRPAVVVVQGVAST